MLLIGAGLHINGRLSGSGLASETNAVLVSYAFSMSLFLGFVSDHTDSTWGDYLAPCRCDFRLSDDCDSCESFAHFGSKNQRYDAQPMAHHRWFTHHHVPADFVLDLHDAVLESMEILPMLASGLAVALYVAPFVKQEHHSGVVLSRAPLSS